MQDTTPKPEAAPAPVVQPSNSGAFLKRQLSGATFLSFEHAVHMLLVVIVAGLVAAGINSALNMWMGGGSVPAADLGSVFMGMPQMQALMAPGIVAALIILVPIMIAVDRRTRAEWQKRPGYSARLAYKLPLYSALGFAMAGKITAEITMLGVIINSLVMIGVPGIDAGAMYTSQFIPALISALVFSAAGWYLFKLAKGHDMGKSFSMLMAVVSLVVSVALLITTTIVMHQAPTMKTYPSYPSTIEPDRGSSLDDLFKY